MNILYYGLSSNQGGIETYLYKIARNINRDKFKIFYMDETGGNACFRKELEDLGADFFDITPRRISICKNKRDLETLFTHNHFDVLHFNCNSLSYIAPILIAKKHGVKIVLHSRNSRANFFSSILHRINFFRINYWMKNDIYKVAVSDIAGQWMFGKEGKYEVINNGVEIERFKYNEMIRLKKRKELNLETSNIYGNVGAFLEAKNHVFILKIFKEILKKDTKAVLLLIGDGPLKAEMESLAINLGIANKVKFLGIRKDIPELMMAMDCLIFPSLYEGFPNVILEAETTGLPIVMSHIITDEVVVLDSCKKLNINCTIEEWTDMCVKFATTKTNRQNSANNIEEAGFSVKSEIIKIEKIYEKVRR